MIRRKYDFDLIVIGAGSAGGVAAQMGIRLGKKVAIVEAGTMGGECPNIGCVPTKSLLHAAEIYDAAKHADVFGIDGKKISYDYHAMKAWKDLAVHRTGTWEGKKVFESVGVKVISGYARFANSHTIQVGSKSYTAKNFLIATGTSNFIPPIEGLEETGYITYKQAINFEAPPKSIFIVGAGAIGCEFAELFSIFDAKVYLADVTPRLMMKEDVEVSDLARQHFENNRDISVFMHTQVVRVEPAGKQKRIHYQREGRMHSVIADELMIATGKKANVNLDLENAGVGYTPRAITVNPFMQTAAKHIYAAGDVVGPYMFTHMAEYQARLAANNMWRKKRIAADYRAVPRCIFINPEIASVGVSESDCSAKKVKIKTALAPISLIGRANTSNVEEGFVKIITRADGVIIGASIVSPRAGEMIHELALAIQLGITAQQVANTIHAFPTWSEAVRIACAKLK